VTLGENARNKLKQLQDLLAHQVKRHQKPLKVREPVVRSPGGTGWCAGSGWEITLNGSGFG
jgi:hypothetical protein